MTTDLCPTTSPHGPHRRDLGPFGAKQCPGVTDPATAGFDPTDCAFCVAAVRRLPNGASASCPLHGEQLANAAPYDAGHALGISRPLPVHDGAEQLRQQVRALETANNELSDRISVYAINAEKQAQALASQAEQLRRNGTLLCRLRDLDEQRDRAWAEHDTVRPEQDQPGLADQLDEAVSMLAQIGDAISPTGERPEEALGTLVADVAAVAADRDALQAAIEHADSVRIDTREVIWRPAPDGQWQHPIYGTFPLDHIHDTYGPTRAAWLIDHAPDDDQAEQDPTVAERLTTTAHAANDLADQLAQMEGERDRLRDELARTCEQLHAARAELAHVGLVLTDWRASFTGEPTHEADRVLADLIDGGLVPTADQPMPPVAALGSPPARVQDPHVQSAARELLQHLRATEPLRPAVVEYGIRLHWDGGRTEDQPRGSVFDAERAVALHAEKRRTTPGWRATAELIRRTVTTGPWEPVQPAADPATTEG